MPNRDADADAPAASVTLREREGGPVSATDGRPGGQSVVSPAVRSVSGQRRGEALTRAPVTSHSGREASHNGQYVTVRFR